MSDCTIKEIFNTASEARTRAQGLSRAKKNLSLSPYLCPHCGKYHLSSTNKNRALKKKKNKEPDVYNTNLKKEEKPQQNARQFKKNIQPMPTSTYTLGEILKDKLG